MSDSKKDLTRIEDLGEYLHELSQEEEIPAFEETELPNVPEDDSSFGSETFSTDDSSPFGEESSTFAPQEDSNFSDSETFTVSDETSDSATFESQDFSSSDFETPEFTTSTDETNRIEEDAFTDAEESSFSSSPESSLEDLSESIEDSTTPVESTSSYFQEEIKEQKSYKAPETFEDIKKFAENSAPMGMGAEGNPSFSVLLKNIRYIEDVNDILLLLKEFSLLADSEEQVKKRMMRGQLLIPRISEYSAIFLAHKLRRFDIDIQVGLSDEIHPPKHQELPETGVVSKSTLIQNQTHHFQFSESRVDLGQIIISATPSLDGFQILKYLGVASEHKIIDGLIVEDESSEDIPRYYQELAQKLKAHALKANANAITGINYQLTPLPTEYGISGSKFRLSCTGNLVWVNKL